MASLALMLTLMACGSSEDSSDNGASKPVGDGKSALTQSYCETQAHYIWYDGACTLQANTRVTNLQAIEYLPKADKEDLISWLVSVEKSSNLDVIFPRWDDFKNEVDDPFSSESTSQPVSDAASSHTFIDDHFLAGALKDSGIVNFPNEQVVLGAAVFSSNTFHDNKQASLSLDGVITIDKSVKIILEGGELSLLINELEVYRFNAVTSIPVLASISKNNIAMDREDLIISYEAPNDAYRVFSAAAFMNAFNENTQASDGTKTDLVNYLGLSSQHGADFFTLATMPAITYKADFNDSSTQYFNSEYKNVENKFKELEDEEDSRVFFLNNSTTSLTVSGFFNVESVLPTFSDNNHRLLKLDIQFAIDVTGELTAFDVAFNNASASELTYINKDTQIFTEAFITRAQILQTAFASFTTTPEGDIEFTFNNFPIFNELTHPITPFIHPDDGSVFSAISHYDTTYRMFLKLAQPTYRYDDVIYQQDIVDLRDWNEIVQNFMQYLFVGQEIKGLKGRIETALDQLILTIEPVPSDNTGRGLFYRSIVEEFKHLTSDLNESHYGIYAAALMDLVVVRAYHNAPVSELSRMEMLAALQQGGQAYSAPLKGVINSLKHPKQDSDGKLFFDETRAMGNFREFISLHQLNPNLTQQLIEHDVLTRELGVDEYIPKLFSLDHSLLSQDALNTRIQTHKVIKDFVVADRLLADSPTLFDSFLVNLAKQALHESWNATTFQWLKVILDKVYLKSHCTGASYTEKFKCITKLYLSALGGQGYLVDYGDGQNPYVLDANKLVDIRSLSTALTASSFDAYFPTNVDNQIKKGLWLGCGFDDVRENITQTLLNLQELTARVSVDSSPAFDSQEYNDRKAIVDDIEALYEDGCS